MLKAVSVPIVTASGEDVPIVAQTLAQKHTQSIRIHQANLLQRCALPPALVSHHSEGTDYPSLDVCNASLAHGVFYKRIELTPPISQLTAS